MSEAIFEAERHLKSAPDQDVEKFSNAQAMNERIREWFETPEGTMAHNPSWGQNISPFKHDPMSKTSGLDVQIEMAIVYKLPLDVEDIQIVGVDVDISEIDMAKVYIIHQYGDVIINFVLR